MIRKRRLHILPPFRVSSQIFIWLGAFVLLFFQNSYSESVIKKSKTKRQYIENDNYFKTSQLNNLSAKISNEEKPWGFGFHASAGTDMAKKVEERTYKQSLSMSAGYKLNSTQSLGLQSGISYYSVGNTVPKEEGNPAWDDISLSWGQQLGEINNLKLGHSVSTFAPTSYDSQYEGIKSGLSYGVNASHQFYFISFKHSIGVSHTFHTFDYSPTTNRRNSPWSNSYNLSVGAPYKFNKHASAGISQNFSNRSAFDGNYFLVTSTLIYGGFRVGGANLSLNYLFGSYDENKTMRYFYTNEWEQRVSLGVSYDI